MLRSITIQDQIYERLNEMIIKTELYPGQKLSESKMMELLGVGRTPIRESLKQLKKQHLLHTFPQSGTYVSKIDMNQANHSRFVRLHTEREVMTELCDVLDERAEKRLQSILNKQKLAFEDGNISSYHDFDNAFHRTCYEMVGKGQVWDWIRETSIHLDRIRWLILKNITFDYNQILEEHHSILAAIKNGNKEDVSSLVTRHIHFMDSSQIQLLDMYPDYFSEDSVSLIREEADAAI